MQYMIRLSPVNEQNFRSVVGLQLSAEQTHFVASNMMSLAQAWLYYGEARPYAVLNDDTVVGFLMLDWDEAERTVGIWRFMIGAEYQKKGYGRAALEAAIAMIRAEDKFDLIHLDYVADNTVARALYYSLGFRENGDVEDGEIIMTLPLTDTPKVGMLTADEEDLAFLHKRLEDEARDAPEVFRDFPDWSVLEEAVKTERLTRFTVFGETIALAAGEQFWCRKKYAAYTEEALLQFRRNLRRKNS